MRELADLLASPSHFPAVAIPEILLAAKACAGHVDISVCDVYCEIMTSKELIALLNKHGWTLRGSKGSHHVFVHASKAGHLTVPHPKKDLGTGLVQKILKQAGLK
jgi:predicted RNA binding protein YcfA (HicA-like mRNA interferase family)